jgi:D-alanyl-D-alanine carboxypeptidase
MNVPPPPAGKATKYAAIVVDANEGRALFAVNASEPRYPASLTKMMTLYMLFEALDSGRVRLDTPIPVSAYAAGRPPSRLGLRPGQTIDVETAIRALVIKSANDVASAVAEYLGGSESGFAQMMTANARALGLSGTTFRNASGLPDPGQISTARDMARLGLLLRARFPHYYHYFRQTQFVHGGRTIRGHNELLRTLPGADGIKTGYIRASGFNVATSVSRHGKNLLVVVTGGDTAAKRNAHVTELVERYLPAASAGSVPIHASARQPISPRPPLMHPSASAMSVAPEGAVQPLPGVSVTARPAHP